MNSATNNTVTNNTGMTWLRSSFWISVVSARRLLFTWQSAICLAILAVLSLLSLLWRLKAGEEAKDFVEFILTTIFVSIFLPLAALCFGTAGIGRERDSKTLVYLVSTPTPRPIVYYAKFVAMLAVTMLWTCGGYLVLLASAGIIEAKVVMGYLPTIILGSFAYVALFQLMSVVIRFATIVSFLYIIFFESLVGNIPGTTKRVTVSFYVKCLILDASETLGFERENGGVDMFQAISGGNATLVLIFGGLVLILLGSLIFWRKEYV
jgi:ABC-2 type transport system permease protein